MTEVATTADAVRWAVSRLGQRLRAEHAGRSAVPLTRLSSSLLATLRHRESATVTELAHMEGLAPQSLTRTLNALEEQGHVHRFRDEADRRAQRVVLTDTGRAALEEHVADGNRWLAEAIASTLTPAERRVLDVAADLLVTVAGYGDPSGSRRAHWGHE